MEIERSWGGGKQNKNVESKSQMCFFFLINLLFKYKPRNMKITYYLKLIVYMFIYKASLSFKKALIALVHFKYV